MDVVACGKASVKRKVGFDTSCGAPMPFERYTAFRGVLAREACGLIKGRKCCRGRGALVCSGMHRHASVFTDMHRCALACTARQRYAP
eukprot:76526-Chlamydomonas_euryale.AAC.1